MNTLKTQIVVIVASLLTFSFAHADEKLKMDRESVNSACSQEATTAGCSGMKVGKGLLKCIKEYHEKHSDFKPGAGCEGALAKLREDRKEIRKAKKEAKHDQKVEEKKDSK